ncbi:MAG TPA: cadmium-translocating P-type ATPase [Lachnospiraceae bacterium]|nr:cadmium-translocating P-type ATPase [Lachnospiraceae bacterium]
MEKMVIELKGLTCSHCGGKIENDVQKLNGVVNATLNLMKQELAVEFKEDKKRILEDVKIITNKYEPDVKVGLKDQGHSGEDHQDEENTKIIIIRFAVGILMFIAAVAIKEPQWLSTGLFMGAYFIFGGDVLVRAIKNISKGQIFDENFLMSIATVGAIAIGEMPEAVFVMLFYQVGEFFQSLAVEKSRKSIRSLMDIRPDHANLLADEKIVKTRPEEISIDDIIVVKPGERVPLDGVVIDGESAVDTSALTGESVPKKVYVNSEVLSGSINTSGLLKIRVTQVFEKSTVVKILELTENAASKKTKAEQFITKFARIYTPIVVLCAVVLAVVPPIFTSEADLKMWIGRALIFLVVSCPCALVLSVPLGFFSGIGEASKNGILVKGSNYLQALCKINTVVMDKTGTITEGVFEVTEIKANGVDEAELLKLGAYAEKMSNHPIAKSIVNKYEVDEPIDVSKISDYEEIGGYGVSAVVEGKKIFAGNLRLMKRENILCDEFNGMGSVVYLGANGKYFGRIVVSDRIKKDSEKAIKAIKSMGIKNTVILTGDSKKNADMVCEAVGADVVYSQLLPQDKVKKVEELYSENSYSKILFVGDGINDAPVLSRAEVGIAMGGVGSDAAIEAADVVIMNDDLMKIANAIKIARNTNTIVMQNIVFALGVKAVVLAMGAMGMATMWMAVFADVGVAFIAVLNSMRKKLK